MKEFKPHAQHREWPPAMPDLTALERPSPANQRKAVRYRRTDIKAMLKVRKFFSSRMLAVNIHDISSRGIAVVTPIKLADKSKVTLHLLFADGRQFVIDAVVVYGLPNQLHGLKFNKVNADLAEHLLETQTDLTFSI